MGILYRIVYTIDSKHNLKAYTNLAKDLVLNRTYQIWYADYSDKKVIPTFEHGMLKA